MKLLKFLKDWVDMSRKRPFFQDSDDEQDRAVDNAMKAAAKSKPTPEVAITVTGTLPTSTYAPIVAKSLESLTDEELAQELARRRTAKIDAEILALEQQLASKRQERIALMSPNSPADASSVFTHGVTKEAGMDVRATQPKIQSQKLKPGSRTPEECDCPNGCYLCTTSV